MQHPPRQAGSAGTIASAILAQSSGITMLVIVWTMSFGVRWWLSQNGKLTQILDEALLSMLLVVPIMLIGWGLLAVADRAFRLGLFGRRD
jgi:hypothetical protein